jgi:hypothetical protein
MGGRALNFYFHISWYLQHTSNGRIELCGNFIALLAIEDWDLESKSIYIYKQMKTFIILTSVSINGLA